MKAKKLVKKILPKSIYSKIKAVRNSERVETLKLNALDKLSLDTSNLKPSHSLKDINDIFDDKAIWEAWALYDDRIQSLNIPDLTGGVNVGDRKALFFILSYIKPKSVLEVGTHIGASTVHIASALDFNSKNNKTPEFTTLDIRDVNCEKEKPWVKFKSPDSPQNLIKSLDLGILCRFKSQDSLEYFDSTSDSYDFIFLDGDHSAQTVYKELPKAIKRLNQGGIILLHDYFELGGSANPNNKFNSGPYLAIRRYLNEDANIKVVPLGELPWTTKYDSNITSLALVFKK